MNVEVKPTPASASMLIEPPLIARLGVIGAGQMGNGIAHVCALAGLQVNLLDVEAGRADQGHGDDGSQHGPPGQSVDRSRQKTGSRRWRASRPGTDYAMFDDADLVIEAATEKEDIKRAIFSSWCRT